MSRPHVCLPFPHGESTVIQRATNTLHIADDSKHLSVWKLDLSAYVLFLTHKHTIRSHKACVVLCVSCQIAEEGDGGSGRGQLFSFTSHATDLTYG